VRTNRYRHQVEELAARLSRARAQAVPENALTLSVMRGTTVLTLTSLSGSTASAIKGVVRLFV
jgi:Tfp pilus assembly protein FimT